MDGKLKAKSIRNSPLGNLDSGAELWLSRHHRNNVVRTHEVYFDGALDELAFYRKALSAEAIQGIYQAGRNGKCTRPSTTFLSFLYPIFLRFAHLIGRVVPNGTAHKFGGIQ